MLKAVRSHSANPNVRSSFSAWLLRHLHKGDRYCRSLLCCVVLEELIGHSDDCIASQAVSFTVALACQMQRRDTVIAACATSAPRGALAARGHWAAAPFIYPVIGATPLASALFGDSPKAQRHYLHRIEKRSELQDNSRRDLSHLVIDKGWVSDVRNCTWAPM